jgi:hypothetical protein
MAIKVQGMLKNVVLGACLRADLVKTHPMLEAIHSSETSVHTRATLHLIRAYCILHNHLSENLKYYIKAILLKFKKIFYFLVFTMQLSLPEDVKDVERNV